MVTCLEWGPPGCLRRGKLAQAGNGAVEKANIHVHKDFPPLCLLKGRENTHPHKDLYVNTFTVFLHDFQKV